MSFFSMVGVSVSPKVPSKSKQAAVLMLRRRWGLERGREGREGREGGREEHSLERSDSRWLSRPEQVAFKS